MTVRVVQPNSRTLAQLPEQPPFDSLAQPAKNSAITRVEKRSRAQI
jgi:hypothetical protein